MCGSQRSGPTTGPVDGLERCGRPIHPGAVGVSRSNSLLATSSSSAPTRQHGRCGGSESWTPTSPTAGPRSRARTRPRPMRGVTRSDSSRSNGSSRRCQPNLRERRRPATGPAANDDTATTDARRRAIRTRPRTCEPAQAIGSEPSSDSQIITGTVCTILGSSRATLRATTSGVSSGSYPVSPAMRCWPIRDRRFGEAEGVRPHDLHEAADKGHRCSASSARREVRDLSCNQLVPACHRSPIRSGRFG